MLKRYYLCFHDKCWWTDKLLLLLQDLTLALIVLPEERLKAKRVGEESHVVLQEDNKVKTYRKWSSSCCRDVWVHSKTWVPDLSQGACLARLSDSWESFKRQAEPVWGETVRTAAQHTVTSQNNRGIRAFRVVSHLLFGRSRTKWM